MAFSGILAAAATATTNPNPNALSVVSPYPTPYVNRFTVSAAWAAQAGLAMFPTNALNGSGQVPIPLQFIPSVAGATYTVTLWSFNKLANAWIQPKDNASFTMTGSDFTEISDPGVDPLWLQISNVSSGTVAIYFDNGFARGE